MKFQELVIGDLFTFPDNEERWVKASSNSAVSLERQTPIMAGPMTLGQRPFVSGIGPDDEVSASSFTKPEIKAAFDQGLFDH